MEGNVLTWKKARQIQILSTMQMQRFSLEQIGQWRSQETGDISGITMAYGSEACRDVATCAKKAKLEKSAFGNHKELQIMVAGGSSGVTALDVSLKAGCLFETWSNGLDKWQTF